MQPLIWESRPDGLRAPAMVCAFKGWNDAGDAASAAVAHIGSALGATRFARIDPEEFYDFQATRPMVKLVGGQARELVWPGINIYQARVPRAPRDLILIEGPEPSFRWRGFSALLIDLAEALGVQIVVTLGALLADTPHTLPVVVSGLASDASLVERLGVGDVNYEGPTGIVGALQHTCAAAGIPTVSLWAQVPHYVAQPPSPKATLALLRGVEDILDVPLPMADLPEEARAWERGVDELAQQDSEVADYVRTLEEAKDAMDLPEASGDAIAREFERYFRRHGGAGES